MFQTQLITQVVDWERRLEIDEERRKSHRSAPPATPYVNYLAPVQGSRKERRSLFAWLFRSRKEQKPAYQGYPQESCCESQPG